MFVAGFIGSPAMNLLELPCTHSSVHFGDLVFPVGAPIPGAEAGRVILGVRPEDLELSDHGLEVKVELVEVTGPDAYVYGRAVSVGTGDADTPVSPGPGQSVDADGNAQIVVRTPGEDPPPPEKGDILQLAPRPGTVHLFDAETEHTLEIPRTTPS